MRQRSTWKGCVKHCRFMTDFKKSWSGLGMDQGFSRLLDLGVGTGETSRRCLAAHPEAALIAIDASAEMLKVAAHALGERAEYSVGRLEDPLPQGPFELVVSALAIHHLDGGEKANLFRRIHECLAPAG